MELWSGVDLHDDEHTQSNISQIANLYAQSGLSAGDFQAKMHEARKLTLQRSGSITKRSGANSWEKNRAPYFFACLKDLLGLTGDGVEGDVNRPG